MCAFTERLEKWWAAWRRKADRESTRGKQSVRSLPGADLAACVVVGNPKRWLALLPPFLTALLPILVLYLQNLEESDGYLVALLCIGSLGCTAVFLGLSRLALGNLMRAAVFISVFNLWFFCYGRVFDLASPARSGFVTVLGAPLYWSTWHKVLILLSVAILVCAFSFLRCTRRDLWPATRFLSGALSILAALIGVQILWQRAHLARPLTQDPVAAAYRSANALPADSSQTPDVYYIILDGYARHDVLQNVFDHDNTEFLDFLRSRGFYVAEQSCSNYPFTFMSLASSLSMRYLNEEIKPDEGRPSRRPFVDLIHRPLIGRIFQSKGYRFIHFTTNTTLTGDSDYADEVVGYQPRWLQNEFTQVLFRTTPLRIFEPSVAQIHLNTFGKLKEIPKIPGPTFTFAHIICPHRPFVFDADGAVLAGEPQALVAASERRGAYREAYINQMKFVNHTMRGVVDEILNNSRTQPIIIIQADHGTNSLVGGSKSRAPADIDLLARERLPILNAYLVPEAMREKLYPSITPINSFRLLFNTCFGEHFELLPERNYIGWYNAQFKLHNATQTVTEKGAPSPEDVKLVDSGRKKKKAKVAATARAGTGAVQ